MRPIDAENFEVLSWKATDNQDYNDGFNDGVIFVTEKIDNAPTIEVAPVAHGRWTHYLCVGHDRYKCSECSHWINAGIDRNYCPNCGAKMINEE